MREGRNDAALPFRDAVRKRQLSGTARHGVRAVKGAASVGEIRSKKGPEMFAGGEFGEFPVDEFSLVLEDLDGNEHVLHLDRPEYGKKCLEWLEKVQSSIKIGKMKQ